MRKKISFKKEVILLEKLGARFYTKLAQAMPEPTIKEILEVLAKEELNHIAKIEELTGVEGQEELLDQAFFEVTRRLEFSALEAQDAERRIDKFTTEREMLGFALNIEKKSLEFYTALVEQIEQADLKAEIDTVRKEEQDHFDHLSRLILVADGAGTQPILSDAERNGRIREALDSAKDGEEPS